MKIFQHYVMNHLSPETGEKEQLIGHVVQNFSHWCERSFDLCIQQFLQLSGMHSNQITAILDSISTKISDRYATLKLDTGNTEIHERIQNGAGTRSSKPQIFF